MFLYPLIVALIALTGTTHVAEMFLSHDEIKLTPPPAPDMQILRHLHLSSCTYKVATFKGM